MVYFLDYESNDLEQENEILDNEFKARIINIKELNFRLKHITPIYLTTLNFATSEQILGSRTVKFYFRFPHHCLLKMQNVSQYGRIIKRWGLLNWNGHNYLNYIFMIVKPKISACKSFHTWSSLKQSINFFAILINVRRKKGNHCSMEIQNTKNM